MLQYVNYMNVGQEIGICQGYARRNKERLKDNEIQNRVKMERMRSISGIRMITGNSQIGLVTMGSA